jgi:tetratricopeptide (TPR) repeat protein
LSEAYENGAVLAFYFADQLKGLENSGFDIASSFRDIILSLDATKETNRLPQFADARKRAATAREARKSSAGNINESVAVKNPVTVKLLDIDKIIQSKNYPAARVQLNQLLDANPNEAPRIYYALGRISSLQAEGIRDENVRNQHLLDAKVAYENVLRTATGKIDSGDTVSINVNSPVKGLAETALTLLSRSYVALGRIYEYDGEDDYAAKIYEAAVKIGRVPDGAYDEAFAAKERLLKKQ